MHQQQQRKEMLERSEMIQRMADTTKTKKLKPPVGSGSSSSKHVHSASLSGMKSSKILISQSPQRNQVGTVSSQPTIQDNQLSKPFPYDQYNPKGSNSWTNESTLKKFADFQEINSAGSSSSQRDRNTNISSSKVQQQYQQPQEQSGMVLPQPQQQTERNARLTDLCAEDKKKIGELIMKLASEKEEKDSLARELELKQQEYAAKLQSLMNENRSILSQGSALEEKFKQNLSILASQQQGQQQQQQPQRSQVGLVQGKEQGENKHYQQGQLQQGVDLVALKSTVVGTITATTNNKTLQPPLAKQSTNNQVSQQQDSSSEDEMEIAKKWRSLKRSRENSIDPITKPSSSSTNTTTTTTINPTKACPSTTNATVTATPLSPSVFSSLQQPYASPQFSQLSPNQNSSTTDPQNIYLNSTQNPQPSQQQLDLPRSATGTITKNKENNSNNSNSVDVEDIKKLNTYLMSKLRALNDPVKITGKGSIQKQGSSADIKYQFHDDDGDQEEKEDQQEEIARVSKELKSTRKANRHTDKKKDKYDQEVNNSNSKSSKQSKKITTPGYSVPDSTIEGKHKQHSIENHHKNQRNKNKNVNEGGYDQYYQQEQFKQYNHKNHMNNQRSSSSSPSSSSSGSLSNSQQSCSSSSSSDDNDNQISELAATAVNMREQLSRLTMLNSSGLSTPCPEKISIEPYDLLASIKNYNNNYNSSMYPRNQANANHSRHINDSYTKDNSNNKNNKKKQQQQQYNQLQEQYMHQTPTATSTSSKEQLLRREIEAAITQLGPAEAQQFLAEMLHSKQSAQKDTKKLTKQSNYQPFNHDSFDEDEDVVHEHNINNHRNDYSQISQQDQVYNNINSSITEHKPVRTNHQGNMRNTPHAANESTSSHSCNTNATTSIHKKTFLDDDDAAMISILNGDDHLHNNDDNLFDLIQNIEESANKYNKHTTQQQQQQQDYYHQQQYMQQQQQQQPQITFNRRF